MSAVAIGRRSAGCRYESVEFTLSDRFLDVVEAGAVAEAGTRESTLHFVRNERRYADETAHWNHDRRIVHRAERRTGHPVSHRLKTYIG